MEVVFPLHAAWVWNNYFLSSLSLSLSFSLFLLLFCVVLWHSSGFGTVHHSVCTPPLATTPSSPPPSLPRSSSSSLSVVYQDGFYGAADLYVSKLTSHPTTQPLCPLPSRLSPALFFFFPSGGDSACCVRSCATQSCLHKGEWAHSEETQRTTWSIQTQDPPW